MPILLRTQVERTAKTPVTARRARVGGLCRFRRPAERVPAGSPKTGRCADVRENRNSTRTQHSGFGRKRKCGGMDETCRLRRGDGYGDCIDEAAKQEKAKVSCAHLGRHICPQCGQFWAVKTALFCGCQTWNDAVIAQNPQKASKIKDNFDAITISGGFEHENRRTKPPHSLDGR